MATDEGQSHGPVMLRLRVSYSVGMKVNLGNYESCDLHLSEAHEYDTTGMSDKEIEDFRDETRSSIAQRLSDEIVQKAILAKEDGNIT